MPTKIVLDAIGHSVDSLEDSEAAVYRLATDPALAGVTGRFYDRTKETKADPSAYDPEVQRRLWQLSLDLTRRSRPRLSLHR